MHAIDDDMLSDSSPVLPSNGGTLNEISLKSLHDIATANLIADTSRSIAEQYLSDLSLEQNSILQPNDLSFLCQREREISPPKSSPETPKSRFHCSVCSRSFSTKQHQENHARTHDGLRPFTCHCGRSYTTIGNLRTHQRTHSGSQPYKCSFPDCERFFTEYSNWRKHQVTHTGEKRFVCLLCGMSFSQSGSRNKHIRRCHAGEEQNPELN